MSRRLNVFTLLKAPYQAWGEVEAYLGNSSVGVPLLELVRLRVSQLNGCAYCLDMHSRALRKEGETQQRIDLLPAWREVPTFFTDRERAALDWAEHVTLIATRGPVPDALYDAVAAVFEPQEIADLAAAVAQINSWNRMAIPFHVQPPRS